MPLTAAIMRRNWSLVNLLICCGAAVNNPPEISIGMSPLAAAISSGDEKLVRYLIGAGANPRDSQALEAAANDIGLLQLLLAELRSHSELREAVEALLGSQVVDVNSYHNKSTVLHDAIELCVFPDPHIIRILLSSGADPNSTSEHFSFGLISPLLLAIDKGDSQTVQLLLEGGAKPNGDLASKLKLSPVQFAVRNLFGKSGNAIVQILLQNGSDPDAFSPHGSFGSPIQIAAEDGNIEIVRILFDYKANPNTINPKVPHTALQIAARDGRKDIVDILIEHGAEVNSPPTENSGATALQFSAIGGFLGITYLLLENGADVNAPAAPINGRTALEGAVEHGRLDMVQLLLNAGADIHGAGKNQYEGALRLASKNGDHAIRRLLETYHG